MNVCKQHALHATMLHWLMLGGLCCREMHAYYQSCTTPCTGMQVTCKGSRLSCQRIFGRMRPRAWNLSSWRAVILAQPVRGESLLACPFALVPLCPGMHDKTGIFWKVDTLSVFR